MAKEPPPALSALRASLPPHRFYSGSPQFCILKICRMWYFGCTADADRLSTVSPGVRNVSGRVGDVWVHGTTAVPPLPAGTRVRDALRRKLLRRRALQPVPVSAVPSGVHVVQRTARLPLPRLPLVHRLRTYYELVRRRPRRRAG